ncbi:hypothetical protein N0V94_002424 [Neodidymelliopsis sp. IMI 364377]|nr:hypothetical protein N0V94_002424 [Neodidymelliopsis sp. IMI 364377]
MGTWQEKAEQKRESLLSAIRPEWRLPSIPSTTVQRNVTGDYLHQFLSSEEILITEANLDQILGSIATTKWTSVSVVTAFSHRAAIAHQITNALHEIFFEDGIKRAAELDTYIKEHGRPIGPLHGLPISLKDSINVKGVDTTNGFVGLIGVPAKKDAELARILRSLGAILYCKTAVPQASFAAETENNIIGYTTNAYNRLLSSGGSSGGEGPLLALRGSVIGLGSDIGGSIRHPAALNGLFGLKPSYRRLPIEGVNRVMEGQDMVPFSWGPLSSSAAGLTLLMKSILSQEPWLSDPRVVEIPWRDDMYQDFLRATKGSRQLVFGIMRNDGVVQPQPPISRGLDMLIEKVESLGHKMATWLFDGSTDVLSKFALSGEPIVDSVSQIFGAKPGKQSTATEMANVNIAIWDYRKRYMDYWNSTKELTGTGRPVDAVIAPTYPYAGIIPGKLKYAGYTPYGNVLDYSVGVIPVTKANKDVDKYPTDFTPFSEIDEEVRKDYDADLQHGSPIGLSIFGRRFQDEKILGVLEALSSE